MSADTNSPIVIVGMACRVPGADSVDAFADLLFNARTGYTELPADRCDRSLYFDPQKGKTGTSYTTLGGIVPERPLDRSLCPLPVETERLFDAVHVQFAEVAATAWQNAELVSKDQRLKCTGMYVGHSGGTKSEGGLSLGTQIEEALSFVDDLEVFRKLPVKAQKEILSDVAQAIREKRPSRHVDAIPRFHAYQAAALAARILGLTGPRSVIDAACASSLVALAQAMMAIRTGRIDSAIVGGATYNNIDNLILFSHSQACTATDSRPFDDSASGLVSSEGYVAIVITTQSIARQHDLPILGVIRGVGTASDGKGRSLWAPRMEGQMLALQRAYSDAVLLDIDYMEAHATSTQLGDATELETLRNLANSSPAFSKGRVSANRLLLGSVKSNIGHTLEAAGLISLVKVLIAMQRRQIPPSLRFEQPNHNYDWTTAPVRVVTRTEPWPEQSLHLRPRRAAVSAFGIGGLNTHVVVEEACGGVVAPLKSGGSSEPRPQLASQTSGFGFPLSTEPIVIVGRGLVVAGAKSLTEFKAILESTRSAISDAPADRWRQRAGVSASSSPQTHRAPHCRGGFITDFSFDGARYRIPPKQVQQSNPVQMMLIDAVAQALDDVNISPRLSTPATPSAEPRGTLQNFPFDRQRVGVVIGAIFGGEFGDQLQVGMRLPEICGQMAAAMQRRGLPPQLAEQVAAEFRQTVLKNRPALLDETGSFTASTLASRVAKTFDLMGGACSLDSDDASGLAALAVATDQLRAGICDMIVCGTAQRSMSLSAFESLDMHHRLVRSGRPEDVPENCQRIIPGEGVVALMLCRLSDAKRLDLPIYGILGDVTQRSESAERPSEVMNAADARIIRKIGYLCGGHSLVRIAAETLKSTGESEPITIAARSSDGIVLQTQLVNPGPRRKIIPDVIPIPSSPLKPQVSSTMTTATAIATSDRPLRRFRFAATSGDSLLRLFRDSISRTDQLLADRDGRIVRDSDRSAPASSHFVSGDQFRSTILAASAEQLRERLAAAIKSVEAGKFSTLLDRERVILWHAHEETSRVAWLFPGQGAHYPETPSVFSSSEHARRTLATVDDLYAASKLPRLSSVFGNAAIKPGEDVWWAQAWVLGVSASLIEALKAEGLRPDAVLGHSFGEFTASLAANVTTLSQSIELAKHRANAVMSHMRVPGGLLSIRAAVHEVDAILKPAGLTVYVTHLNSTRQTVIAGSREGIAAAKALLDQRGLPSMSISVPAPFHTPLLAAAEVAFERMSASVPMRPPVCGFLSATSVQYLAEPCSIRNSLVRQLTQPVMYMPSIQRMLGEGFRVLLEVGPNDVLTRMNRDIVDSQAICLSLDVPGQSFEERMLLVHAVLECVASVHAPQRHASPGPQSSSAPTEQTSSSVSATTAPAVFDVTRTRRATRKPITPSTEPAVMPAVLDTKAALNGRSVHPTELPQRGIQPALQPASSSKTAPAISDAQLRTFTRDLVVELTGYSPEIVDFEADLEADLGIDSIKKAQILGELGEWLGLTVRPESLRLDSVRTLNDAVRVAQSLAGQNVTAPGPVHQYAGPAVIAPPEFSMAVSDHGSGHANYHPEHRGTLPPNDQLDALLIDYVVDQTGYSRDIVDVDADLEADLGLDSIKLAQLIGEMREQFNLESLTLESIGQARFRTLREIREFLVRHASGSDTPGNNNPANRVASAPGYDGRNENNAATPVSTPLVAERSMVGNRATEIRGTEPIREISPEWFTPSNGALQSAEAAGQGGARLGETYRTEIRAALRSLIHQPVAAPVAKHDWNAFESAHLKGVAAGAGVAESSVRFAAAVVRNRQNPAFTIAADTAVESTTDGLTHDIVIDTSSGSQTHRYALKVVPAPRRGGMPLNPELHGAALILGTNALAESLADRIRQLGQTAMVLSTSTPIAVIEKTL
ncbi:MAG: acyltransferase domain-containing protein, partial [Fuerstia sp.]|nr:acyltransferase domain-containing protein [Fuerstiella sp.]